MSDDVRSTASSHAPKKGCEVREVWRSQTCTSGSPFFCLLFFGEAKKSKCPAGMKRMVKITRKANYKAQTLFRLPLAGENANTRGSLKNGVEPNGFLLGRLILLPNASQLFNAAASPLRSAERSILFSGKSVRLSADARSATSSHAPKKGCEVCVGKGRVVYTFSGCLAFVFWLHDDLAAFADYQEPCGFAVPCGILDNLRNPPNLSASKIRKV